MLVAHALVCRAHMSVGKVIICFERIATEVADGIVALSPGTVPFAKLRTLQHVHDNLYDAQIPGPASRGI